MDSPIRELLRSPDFLRLWLVGAFANAMRWLELLASGLFAWEVTHSAFAVTVVVALRQIPQLLFGAFAGAISEALNRKLIFMLALVVPALISTLLATLAVTGHLEVWHVALGNLVSGIMWSTEMSTRRRMVGEVAGPHRIVNAIALDSVTSAATRAIGPLLGGIAFEWLGMKGAYTVTALVQFAGAFAIAGLAHAQLTRRLDLVRIPHDIAEGLRETYPGSAQVFSDMVAEENEHRRRLLDLYVEKFGEHIPLIRRQDVRGFISRKPVWQIRPLGLDTVRNLAQTMELETRRFYQLAAARSTDASIRKLLGDLAEAEAVHEHTADLLLEQNVPKSVREEEDEAERRMFVLRVIQPGLAGLMDGSVSTLAPIFAAAFATGRSWDAFLVGLAASIGAGISMGFAEALSDNGSLTGRGSPWIRGVVCGLMTTLGGIGHTLPFLIPAFWTATSVAIAVVVVELAIISWIRWRYMDTPPFSAAVQVMFGGALVFATGILIGNS